MSKLATERDDLRICDDDELDTRLINARKELFNLRFQVATGRLDNVARIQQVRRQVARILTVQRDREIVAAEASEEGELVAGTVAAEPAEHAVGQKEARRLRRRAAAVEHEAEVAAEEPDDAADVDDDSEPADDDVHGAAADDFDDEADDVGADEDAEADEIEAAAPADGDEEEAVSSDSDAAAAGGADEAELEEGE
jgi:large subunit ribosomal protein L29